MQAERTSSNKLGHEGLPKGFQFSQASLQDYVDCPRRFQLRYLLGLSWPALQTEPALEQELFLEQGSSFHRLVHQHLLGVPAERLASLIHDEELERWWENYSRFSRDLLGSDEPPALFPEISLSTPLQGFRLLAKYDLIVTGGDGKFIIIDWKTSRRRGKKEWFAGRLQTRVYPYLLVMAGNQLNQGSPIPPHQLDMVYWFAEFPDQPEGFSYNLELHRQNEEYLTTLVDEISLLGEKKFSLTLESRHCAFCVYRSLCDRGREAGSFDELDRDWDEDISREITIAFEQIAEIEF